MISSQRGDVDTRGRIRRRQHLQQRRQQQQQEQASPYRPAGRELPEVQQQTRRPEPSDPQPGSQGADQ